MNKSFIAGLISGILLPFIFIYWLHSTFIQLSTVDSIDLSKIEIIDLNNQPISLHSFQDKIIFFNIWATWCKPCIAEIPFIQNAKIALNSDSCIFILASEEELSTVVNFKNKQTDDLMYVKILKDKNNQFSKILPLTYFIKNNKVLYNKIGTWESTEDIVKKMNFYIYN